MAIERLSIIDTITAATRLAASQDGLDQAITIASLTTYLNNAITSPDAKTTEYAAPSATGFTVTLTDSSVNKWLVLTPAAGYATGTIVLPASTNAIDKQEILVNCTQAVTTLTVDGNGATVTGEPATLAANDFFLLRYEGVTNTWYRVG
jgi:hypothetical protein